MRFAIPSLLGGIAGALLLLRTPSEDFSAIVPFLVLGATVLFIAQGPLAAYLRRRQAAVPRTVMQTARRSGAAGGQVVTLESPTGRTGTLAAPPVAFLVYQFLVSIYGGYFGAGMGILMLAALGFMGLVNIHQMNGLKNWGGACINFVAVMIFAVSGIVSWPIALVMAVGATLGGYAGSGLAQSVRQQTVRRLIIVIGLASGVWLLFHQM